MKHVLGIRYGHDAAAAVVSMGRIVADAAEERFSRVKNDTSFPLQAIDYCLSAAGLDPQDLDAVVFPSEGYIPPPFFAFFDVPPTVRRPDGIPELPIYFRKRALSGCCQVLTLNHHLAHAAAAYFTSGWGGEPSLIVTLDGRGDEISAALWEGRRNSITPLAKWDGTASLGWFYASATATNGRPWGWPPMEHRNPVFCGASTRSLGGGSWRRLIILGRPVGGTTTAPITITCATRFR